MHPSLSAVFPQSTTFKSSGQGLWSGLRYRGTGNANTTQIFAVPSGGAFTYTSTFRMLGIVQGASDNSVFTLRAKWTINASGQVTVDRFDVESECRG